MRVPPKADPDIRRAFEYINQRVDELSQGDINMKGIRRCTNAPSAKRNNDYITAGEVKRMLRGIEDALRRLTNVT